MYPSPDISQGGAEARAQEGRQRFHRQNNTKHHSYGDEAWLRWEYSLEEWALFEKVDWRRISLTFWTMASCFMVCLIVMILPWVTTPPDADLSPVLVRVFLPALLVGCLFFIVAMMCLFSYLDAHKRHRARRQAPHTVTFSREGVWEAGTFFALNKFLTADLKKVTLTFNPTVLHFRLLRWHIGNYSQSSPTSATLHVPVPRGREEEAGFLLERFQTEVIQARAQLEKQMDHPLEPR